MARKPVNVFKGTYKEEYLVMPVYGVPKRVFGVDVYEISPDIYYLQEDPNVDATRFYRKEGADFSGWVVARGQSVYSDPIPTKKEAIQLMPELARPDLTFREGYRR